MKNKTMLLVLSSLAIAIAVSSCYPDEDETIEDLDTVVTQYDTDFNFDSKQYYLLPDSVVIITDNQSYEKSEQEIALDETIIDEIAAHMDQAGYTRLSMADTTDETRMNQAVIMLASRSTVTYTNYYNNYYYHGRSYWNWYYGFNHYYPGYYWNYYYPWGYPVHYPHYSYAVGTVIIEMVDPVEPFMVDDNNGEVSYSVRWIAVLNGLASLSQERVSDGINQAFNQSPYLQ